jgi:hypothetical protein
MHVIERSECEVKARRGLICSLSAWQISLQPVRLALFYKTTRLRPYEIRRKTPGNMYYNIWEVKAGRGPICSLVASQPSL